MAAFRIYNGRTKTTPSSGFEGRIVEYALRADAAAAWVRDILPSEAVNAVDWGSGRWTAPLPERIPESAAHDFRRGVLAEPPTTAWKAPDLDRLGPEMAARIAATLECAVADLVAVPKVSLVLFPAQWAVDYLRSSLTAIALIANIGTRQEADAVVWTSPMGSLYPLAGSRLDRDAVASMMDSASGVSDELLLLTDSAGLDPLVSQHLLDGDLLKLFIGAQQIVLGAYDGEGYIRWSRRTTEDRLPTTTSSESGSRRG